MLPPPAVTGMVIAACPIGPSLAMELVTPMLGQQLGVELLDAVWAYAMAEGNLGMVLYIVLQLLPDALFIPIFLAVCANRQQAYELSQLLFPGRGQGLFGFHAFSDVKAGTNIAGELALSVKGHATVKDPTVPSVVAAQAAGHFKDLPPAKGPQIYFQAAGQVARIHAFCPAVAQLLLHGPDREVQPALVKIIAFSLDRGLLHQAQTPYRRIKQAASAAAAKIKCFFVVMSGISVAPVSCCSDPHDRIEAGSNHRRR
ncbi:hypothetical protein DFAR_3460060 [Desulfarculales bacterium]